VKIGFDLDGTLDRPELAKLANQYYSTGHEVHVITVNRLGMMHYTASRHDKVKKLAKLGVKYTKLHLVGGETYSECGIAKAEIITREGIVLMFDDSPTFVKMMMKYTTGCTILEVQPEE
jgi:hypothetical protein